MLSATSVFKPNHVFLPFSGSTSSGYTPAQIRGAYGFTSTAFGSTAADGRGQTIAIIDAYSDPTIASDLAAFDAAYGIAAPASFKVVNQNGGTSLPSADQGWAGEIALDVEWAHAIAPAANIVLVEANSASDNDLFAAVNYARNLASVSVVSMSWGSDDTASNASWDKQMSATYLVTPAGHQGITFVASSGDTGHASFPSTSPNVLSVGGTDLYLTSSGAIANETAWTPTTSGGVTWSGGGGVSVEFVGRKSPDVSYNAGIGMAVLDTYGDGGWVSIGGTSAGSPQWAALVAIADEGRALGGLSTLNNSQTAAALFAAPTADFRDITSGSTQFQTAGVGYDLATGLGSPVANKLIPYLAAYGSTGGTTGTTTAPTIPTNFTATAASTSQINLSWSSVSGATSYSVYELVNGSAQLIGTAAAGASSYSATGLAFGTRYSFEVSAVNSAGVATTGWMSATTLTPAVTVTAPSVTATASSPTAAQVSWSAVSGATGYLIYQWNGSQAVQVGNVGAGVFSASIPGQTSGTKYFYVTAYNGTSSASSGWVSVVIPTAPVSGVAPVLTAKATSSTTGTLSWTATTGATSYSVYYWNGSQSVLLGWVNGSTTAVSISGLTAGSTTQFRIVANTSGASAASAWVGLTTPLSSAAVTSLFAQHATHTHGWWRG